MSKKKSYETPQEHDERLRRLISPDKNESVEEMRQKLLSMPVTRFMTYSSTKRSTRGKLQPAKEGEDDAS